MKIIKLALVSILALTTLSSAALAAHHGKKHEKKSETAAPKAHEKTEVKSDAKSAQ